MSANKIVPCEPNHDQLQLIFNWIMDEPENSGSWWGTSDQIAEAKKFYNLLLAAVPSQEGHAAGIDEPTEAMILAGIARIHSSANVWNDADGIYRAMRAAAKKERAK